MAALILAILSSASLALIFRTTERRGYNRYVITAVNYVAAVVTAMVLLLLEGGTVASMFSEEGPAVLRALTTGPGPGATPHPVWTEIPVILAIGIPGGILFFVSFILYQRSVAEWGPGPAGMYGKLGILVPMVLSMVVWREFPLPLQWAGLVLAFVAIVVSQGAGRPGGITGPGSGGSGTGVPGNAGPGAGPAAGPAAGPGAGPRAAGSRAVGEPGVGAFRPILLVLLVSMGFAEFSNKLFERYGDDRFRALFLVVLFTVAFAGAALAVWRRRITPRPGEIGWGLLVGVPNLFSSYFLIASLQTVPAAVAFPVFSAGSIAVIVLGARVIYGDTLRRRQWVAVALAAGALALINIR